MTAPVPEPLGALEPFHRMALSILRRVVDEGREEDIGINVTAVVINAVDVLLGVVEERDRDIAAGDMLIQRHQMEILRLDEELRQLRVQRNGALALCDEWDGDYYLSQAVEDVRRALGVNT